MNNRSSYIVIAIITLSLGFIFVCVYNQNNQSQNKTNDPRFVFKSGNPNCYSANYRFQSSTEPKVFGADCVLCKELGRDLGNISIRKETTSIQFLLKDYFKNGTVKKEAKTNKNGMKIGERAVWVSKYNEEATRIIWTENKDFWMIEAPTLKLTKEFEESESFKSVKAEVDSACISK